MHSRLFTERCVCIHWEVNCDFKPSEPTVKSHSACFVCVCGVFLEERWGAASTYNISLYSFSAVGSLGLSFFN